MGLDCALVPYYGDGVKSNFSHSILQLERDKELFQRIMEKPAMDVDDGFTSYMSTDDDDYEESQFN